MTQIDIGNGLSIPAIALGTYKLTGERLEMAVAAALQCGYTGFDTAAYYGNESDLAIAFEKAGAIRNKLFVTTKLWGTEHGYDEALRAFDASEKALGVVDMYLIHWPCGDRFLPSWKALERLYEEKRVRAIGVCNFLPRHLDHLAAHANVAPMINQIEASIYLRDDATAAACAERGIALEAWRPFLHGRHGMLTDAVIVGVAQECGKTPAQVCLRFLLQRGYRVLPKASSPERIAENIDIFDFALTADQMARLDSLSKPELQTDRSPDEV